MKQYLELDKDIIVNSIVSIMEDKSLSSLTTEEKSVLIFDHVIEPLSKDINDHYAHIAWAVGNYPSPSGAN